MIGAREWADLNAALERDTPACDGDARFLADELSDDARAEMRRLCRKCPLFESCDSYARAAKPTAGFWAGRQYRARPARPRATNTTPIERNNHD